MQSNSTTVLVCVKGRYAKYSLCDYLKNLYHVISYKYNFLCIQSIIINKICIHKCVYIVIAIVSIAILKTKIKWSKTAVINFGAQNNSPVF